MEGTEDLAAFIYDMRDAGFEFDFRMTVIGDDEMVQTEGFVEEETFIRQEQIRIRRQNNTSFKRARQ